MNRAWQQTIDLITEIFSQYTEIEKVILYGSRAKGNFKAGSDIDLTLQGNKVGQTLLYKINWQLDELPTPYSIDLSILNDIENKVLLEHIQRVGVGFYVKPG